MIDDKNCIHTVVIPTCNRPDALNRCITSVIESVKHYPRDLRIIIADDSDSDCSISQNIESITTIRKVCKSVQLRLYGRAQKGVLAELFASSGIPIETTRFCLLGSPFNMVRPGANRNFLLLAGISHPVISLDDDVEYRFALAGQFAFPPDISQSGVWKRDSPTCYFSYPNRDVMIKSVKLQNIDFLSEHERLLGTSRAEVTQSTQFQRIPIDSSFSPTLDNKVLLTQAGIVGDCGWGSPSRFLFLPPQHQVDMMKSDETYCAGLGSREMVQISPARCLSDRSELFMTTSFGLDERCFVPPFLPLGRGEDIVFARLIKKIYPNMWFGHVPLAITHSPTNPRRFWKGEIFRDATTIDLCSVFAEMIDYMPVCCPTPELILKAIGAELVTIGSLSIKAFYDNLYEIQLRRRDKRVAQLQQQLLRAAQCPKRFQSDILEYIIRLNDSHCRPESAVPIELLVTNELPQAIACTRQIVHSFGILLLHWQEIVCSAPLIGDLRPVL